MDLSDERFHTRTIRWSKLIRDGIDPKVVLVEAQRQGHYRLARSANERIRKDNEAKNALG